MSQQMALTDLFGLRLAAFCARHSKSPATPSEAIHYAYGI